MGAERNTFSQHDLLSVGHNVDLELTLPFLLGPVPWSLSTPDGIPTQTDKSKLMHVVQSHIEPTIDQPCCAVHNFDGIAIVQSFIALLVTFRDQVEPLFNQ